VPDLPTFEALERALVRGGVAPEIIDRTVVELREHYLDLAEEAERAGLDAESARAYAARELGDEIEIADLVGRQDNLLCWSSRHPIAAACGHSVCYAVALPLAPVLYCAKRREALARWGLSCGLAAIVTSSLFLAIYSLFPY
jgi:hypothetical protein